MMPTTDQPKTVGFVGLGGMGRRIASRLLAAGVPLVVHNRTPEKVRELEAAGARVAKSPREVGKQADGGIVFTMTTDAKSQRSVLLGRSGVAQGLPPGGLVVSLSTIAPEESERLSRELHERGLRYVEAPVGGSTDAAEAGGLAVYAAGAPEDVERARPYLERFSRRVFAFPQVGQGAAAKLSVNLLMISQLSVAREALALGEKRGLTREQMLDLLLDGSSHSRVLELKAGLLRSHSYEPASFPVEFALKDVRLAVQAAQAAGLPTRWGKEATQAARRAVEEGRGKLDFAALADPTLEPPLERPEPPAGPLPPSPPSSPLEGAGEAVGAAEGPGEVG